jgi:hypothetical protein
VSELNKAAITFLALAVSLWTVSTATADCRVPRSGWALKPAKHGEIGELYWATQKYSELWIAFEPLIIRPEDQGVVVPQILLIFSVCFPGKNLEKPVPAAQIRAQINRDFIPASVPDPALEISIDNRPFSDLTKRFPHWTAYPDGCRPGDSCPHEAVIVDVPVPILRDMVAGRIVTGDVSGTRFEIGPAQLEQLARFVRRIGQ